MHTRSKTILALLLSCSLISACGAPAAGTDTNNEKTESMASTNASDSLAETATAETATAEKTSQEATKYSRTIFDYFDTAAVVVGYTKSEAEFEETCDFIESQLEHYDHLYDNYHRYDGLNNVCVINREAGQGPVQVDQEIIDLFKYGKEIYELTGGLTDFAMGSVFAIWHEHREEASYDPALASVPELEELQAAAQHCNIDDIIIDEEASTIYYADPDLKCDVGAFAKGYAIERIAQQLLDMGLDNFTLNVGGNVRVLGPKPDGSKWTVAIQNPNIYDSEQYVDTVQITYQALTTSGSYQRYYCVGEERYHHIIHPETLFPENNFLSVSIRNSDAGLGDALSTAVFNMTLEQGQAFIASLEDTEAMWILPDMSMVYSDGFKK